MKPAFRFLLCVCALAPLVASAGEMSREATLSRFFVPTPSTEAMDRIAALFEVTRREDGGFEIIVPERRLADLRALAPNARLLEQDIHERLARLTARELAGYHDFASVESHLKRIAAQYPQIAQVFQYGKSKEGRPLWGLKLSDQVHLDEAEPEVMLTSATHGDELITVEVVFGLLDAIVAGYGKDSRLTTLVDRLEIFWAPVVNPDGYTRKSRYANGIDPNRDYPWPGNPGKQSNECIKGVIDFFHQHEIRGSIDFHSSGGMVMFPWSYTHDPVESVDQTNFAELTRRMAATNGYRHGQIPHLLYIAKGASADYYHWKNRSVAIAVEIGDSNVPAAASIPKYVRQNAEATWIFLESFAR